MEMSLSNQTFCYSKAFLSDNLSAFENAMTNDTTIADDRLYQINKHEYLHMT